ncbi:hypothetical protein O77CONTIG1_03405 [Leptolyngbya sp. O-77]|nr:hypothetical protein O77CONTIG1_03405 [Leptolyngbya sp. O-77]
MFGVGMRYEKLGQSLGGGFVYRLGQHGFMLDVLSRDLKRFLAQKDPEIGIKNGRVDPSRDQHMAHEKNRNGKYYCSKSLDVQALYLRSLEQLELKEVYI